MQFTGGALACRPESVAVQVLHMDHSYGDYVYALVRRRPCNGHIYSVPSLICFRTLQIWSIVFRQNLAFFPSAWALVFPNFFPNCQA